MQHQQQEADHQRRDDLQRQLLARGQAQIALAPQLGVVVPKSDRAEADQAEQRDPHIRIAQVGPQQRRHHDGDDDQQAAHGRRAGFLGVRLGAVFADVLADLKFAQLADQPGPQRDAQQQRRQAGERGPEGRVLEHPERRKVVEQLFEEQPVKHLGVAWTPAPLARRSETLKRPLHVGAARALEQDGVALAGNVPQVVACLGGIVEKKRGVRRQAGDAWLRPPCSGRAAYPNEHINPTRRGITSYVAVQGLGPAAEFEHLPQHRDAPLRRSVPQHVEHGLAPHRDWSCSNRSEVRCRGAKALAAHLARLQIR